MRFILVITQITHKIVSVQGVLSCGQMIVQTIILGQTIVVHLIIYGTMVRKFGAT